MSLYQQITCWGGLFVLRCIYVYVCSYMNITIRACITVCKYHYLSASFMTFTVTPVCILYL